MKGQPVSRRLDGAVLHDAELIAQRCVAMAAGEPGSELLAPLAVVVLGGLVTSTFLNLVVVPAGYALVFRDHKPKQSENEAGRAVAGDAPSPITYQ